MQHRRERHTKPKDEAALLHSLYKARASKSNRYFFLLKKKREKGVLSSFPYFRAVYLEFERT